MDIINEYLLKLAKLIGTIKDEKEMMIRLIVGLAVFVVVLIFKSQISKAVISLINAMFFKKNEKICKAVKESLTKPLSYFFCIIALYGAVGVIVPGGAATSKIATIVKLVVIILIGWFGINLINSDYSFVLSKDDSSSKKTAVKFASNLLKVVIAVIAGLLVLEQFGISATRIFAALGIGGVAVAFACKDAVENMLSGFIIIYDKPFKVDDYIEINSEEGTVEDITMRTTRIRSKDGSCKVYPNTTMANASITNWSNIKYRVYDERISINYAHTGEEIESFVNGIKALVVANEHVIDDGNIRVYFDKFEESSLEIHLMFKVDIVDSTQYRSFKGALNTEIKSYADKNGIDLAFPTRTVHIVDK